MQCASRTTAHREPLVDRKLEDQLMSASGKLRRGMRWPVKVQKGPSTFGACDGSGEYAAIDLMAAESPICEFGILAACARSVENAVGARISALLRGGDFGHSCSLQQRLEVECTGYGTFLSFAAAQNFIRFSTQLDTKGGNLPSYAASAQMSGSGACGLRFILRS